MLARRYILIVPAIVLAVSAGGAALFARAGDTSMVTVSSDSAVEAAIKRASGPLTIRLAPGRYGTIRVGKSERKGRLILESANNANPAIIGELVISANQVTVRNLTIERREGEPLKQYLTYIVNSQDVSLERLKIIAPSERERGREYAVMIRSGDGIRVTDSRISGMRYGIGFLHSRRISIERNELRGLQTDAIRGGGVDDLLIAENVMGDFKPLPGDHPDGIQLWSTNQKVAAKRITIRDNLIARSRGGIIQGIFVRDTLRKLPFEDVEIRGNLVIGGMYNGIAIGGVTRGVIADNVVVAYPDMKSWISVSGGNTVELTNNRAMLFLLKENQDLRDTGNQKIAPVAIGEMSPVTAWLKSKQRLSAQSGPYLKQLSAAGSPES